MLKCNRVSSSLKLGDSILFGFFVVMNDRYMAIGDPGANRVVVFRKVWLNRWLRWRTITPPENSIPFKAKEGFGRELELDQNTLVITALSPQSLENIKDTNNRTSSFYGRYLTRIDKEANIHRIGLKSKKKFESIEFNLLSEGKIKSFTLPNKEELGFGIAVDLYNNLALIGSPSHSQCGKAWLFNLEKIEDEPKKSATLAYLSVKLSPYLKIFLQ